MEAPLVRDVLLLQQQTHLFHAFVEPRAAFIELYAEPRELMRQEGAREADVEAAVAQRVQHRQLAGELQRIVERWQHRAGDETCALGDLSGGSEEHDRVGTVAAVWMKVVLDCPYMAVAIAIAETDQHQRFLPVVSR